MFFSKKYIVVVHNGAFHSDDVFAVATLSILLRGKIKIIRSRNPEDWARGDFVVDVGGVYDPDKNRFDHHQNNPPAPRENGSPYAAFGLVWKKFGVALCGSEAVAQKIDEKIVQCIDILDNGAFDLPAFENGVSPYLLQSFISSLVPTWKESMTRDEAFGSAVRFAESVLQREIIRAKDGIEASHEVKKAYESSTDKRIIILEKNLPWKETLAGFPEPLFVITPDEDNGTWAATAVPKDLNTFDSRKPFPEAWAGKRDEELQKVSGVSDAIFCHAKRFKCIVKSREGAVALTKKSLEVQ